MEIVKGILKPFGKLKSGDAFLYKGKVLMKKDEIIDMSGDTWNAVDTENGKDYCFFDKKVVEAVNASVRMEGDFYESN